MPFKGSDETVIYSLAPEMRARILEINLRVLTVKLASLEGSRVWGP